MSAKLPSLGFLAVAALLALQASAADYSVVGDFSNTVNRNSVWTYGRMDAPSYFFHFAA
ncbi:hypothetical protein [Nitrosovibrio sp. Nv6]|uniref:hypothetical protein n=1 Tax=Nitrosovibrio sp. Nv6 TaxID=1855340 RepID=UPI0013142D57|nr:hypothetical protein [Nitrosovibrio sp. Nv6]